MIGAVALSGPGGQAWSNGDPMVVRDDVSRDAP